MKKNNEEEVITKEGSNQEKPKMKRGVKSSKEKQMKEQIAELEASLAESKDKFLRLYAEFDNYKKRTLKEKIDMLGTAAQETMTAILPVLDDFNRAKVNSDDDNSEEKFSEGVTLVYQKFNSILQQIGLREMETNGEEFNPEIHEAISEIPAPSKKMKGKIIDTVEKGYYLRDKIIRHAKVVVGK